MPHEPATFEDQHPLTQPSVWSARTRRSRHTHREAYARAAPRARVGRRYRPSVRKLGSRREAHSNLLARGEPPHCSAGADRRVMLTAAVTV